MKFKKLISFGLALAITAGMAVTGTVASATDLTPTNAETGVGLTITLSIPCKVTFDLNGKDGTAPTAQEVAVGAKATKPTDPTAEGFVFGGWFTTAECTGTAFDFNTELSAHTTLYAKWTQKGNQTVTAPTAVADLKYTGSAQTLVSAATITTGNTTAGVQYSLDNSTWSATLPTGTNAGTYSVYYKVEGNTEYNEFVCSSPVSVTITRADPTAPTGLTAKTGQTLADVKLPDGWSWVDAGTTNVGEVGNNTFSANYIDKTGNYNDKTDVKLTVTVSSSVTYTLVPAKAATCTATGNKEYYKGSDGKYYTKSGDTYTETTLDAVTIAKTAHTLTAVAAVDAKCTTDGTKAHYKCSVCEKLFEDADGAAETTADALKVAALGHDYVGGTCTRCGAADPNYGGNSGGYTPVIPSGGTTTTTTTTNTGSFADETKENTNYSGAEINMKSDELEKAILTDEDKKVIDAGGTVTVELEVEEMTPTAEEKKEVEAAVEAAKEASGEDYTVAMYFDANLFKTSNGTKTQLHETNGKIAVSFKLPEQFKNTDSSVTRTYAVARIHDGKTEILVCEYDPETDLLTFYTDKFSVYALMFDDTAVEEADVSAVDDDDEQGDEGAVDDDDEQFDETDDDFDELTDDEDDFDDDFAEDQTDSDTDDDDQAAVDAVVDSGETNPNTGAPLAGMGVFAAMSFFAAAAAYTAKKRKNK